MLEARRDDMRKIGLREEGGCLGYKDEV